MLRRSKRTMIEKSKKDSLQGKLSTSAAQYLRIACNLLVLAMFISAQVSVEAASARVNMHQVSRQTNQCK